jgi:hypothetical protein
MRPRAGSCRPAQTVLFVLCASRVYAGRRWWRVGLYAGFCSGASAPWSGSRPRRPSISAGGCPPAPAAYPGVSADGLSSPCAALLPVGFAEPPGSPRALVRSYRTVSPLPVRGRSGDRSRHRRSVLCGTFLRVTPTGRYPAPCPTESGRSSGRTPKHPARGHPAGSPPSLLSRSASAAASELHDRAQHLAPLHAVERGLDVAETDGLGDESVEVELALEV